jgi:hypothetical protein
LDSLSLSLVRKVEASGGAGFLLVLENMVARPLLPVVETEKLGAGSVRRHVAAVCC